jgi:hypothetical protein
VSGWNAGTLARLRQVSIDLTALSATLEVLRARHEPDAEVERAAACVESLIVNVEAIVEGLREQ